MKGKVKKDPSSHIRMIKIIQILFRWGKVASHLSH